MVGKAVVGTNTDGPVPKSYKIGQKKKIGMEWQRCSAQHKHKEPSATEEILRACTDQGMVDPPMVEPKVVKGGWVSQQSPRDTRGQDTPGRVAPQGTPRQKATQGWPRSVRRVQRPVHTHTHTQQQPHHDIHMEVFFVEPQCNCHIKLGHEGPQRCSAAHTSKSIAHCTALQRRLPVCLRSCELAHAPPTPQTLPCHPASHDQGPSQAHLHGIPRQPTAYHG